MPSPGPSITKLYPAGRRALAAILLGTAALPWIPWPPARAGMDGGTDGGMAAQTGGDLPIPPPPVAACGPDPEADAGWIPVPGLPPAGTPIRIHADRAEGDPGRWTLSGDVRLRWGGRALDAPRLEVDRGSDRARAPEGLSLLLPGLYVEAAAGSTDLGMERGQILGAAYELTRYHARGHAREVTIRDPAHLRLEDLDFTTCLPTDRDWVLQANSLDLDLERGVGTARGVRLRLGAVPVAWTPWLRFPIDERRESGFLTPAIGRRADSGTDLTLPYYLNLAPNYDATLYPRLLSRRGAQLGAEFRYLLPRQQGEFRGEFLPGDRIRGTDRYLVSLRQRGQHGAGWGSTIKATRVSDRDYFDDLGNDLRGSNRLYLEQRADLGRVAPQWRVLLRAQAFQPLEESNETYRRLPQIRASGSLPLGPGGARLEWRSELVRFDHADAGTVDTGTRLDLEPAAEIELGTAAWRLVPRLAVRHTAWRLDRPGDGETAPSRTAPVFSVDGALFLERRFTGGLVHVVEPRLHYLYVPYRAQDELPVFDTAALDLTYSQLFRDSRFTGADRLGDANQLGVGVGNRLLDGDGSERLRLDLGGIIRFETPRVALPGQDAGEGRSDVVAELGIRPWPWLRLAGTLQRDLASGRDRREAVRLRLRRDRDHILDLDYRRRPDDDLEQGTLALRWPLGRRWTGVARWDYSLAESRTLESFAGLEYAECCWRLRLVGRRYLRDLEDPASDGVSALYLQLSLRGLGDVGDDIETLLERGILGYGRAYDLE